MRKKSLSVLLALCMLFSLVQILPLTASAADASITLAGTVEADATSVVFNTEGFVSGSWVALYAGSSIPSPNTAYVDYVYVNADTSTATFPSNDSYRMKDPTKWKKDGGIQPGTYLAVLYDANYGVLAQHEFTVEGEATVVTKMTLPKTTYSYGEEIVFTYENSQTDKDWIGIYVRGVTNKYDPWSYTKGESGTITFKNIPVGQYTAKYFYNDRSDAANMYNSIDFEVVEGGEVTEPEEPSFSLEKTEFTVGEEIVFTYKNAKTATDWIGIYPEGKGYDKWGYTPTGSGTLTITGLTAGKYTAKFFYNGYSDDEHMYGSIDFTVVESGEPDPDPEPDPEPSEPSITVLSKVSAGDAAFSVRVTGANSNSWIALYHSSHSGSGYDDYLDTGKDGVYTFPSGQKVRQRYNYFPYQGTITEGEWYIVLYKDGGYTEIARTEFTVVDDKTKFTVGKSIYMSGETVTFTYEKSYNENDFIAVYSDEDASTILEQHDTPNESGSVSFTGSWINTPGTYTAKYYAAGSTETVLGTAAFTVMDSADAPEEGDGIYFMVYGGTGDGKTISTAAGKLDSVIESINADGYGDGDDVTLYVMDTPDALTYRPAIKGRGATESHLTAWGNPTVTHTATIHVKGYNGVDSHIVTQQNFGDYVSASIGGPVIFEDITFVRSRQYDAGMTANGHSLTITPDTVIKAYSSDFGSAGEVWDGQFADCYMVFMPGAEIADSELQGDNPCVIINNTTSNGAEFYFAAWREKHSVYQESAALLIGDLKGKCVIWYTGVNDVTFKKAATILVGEASGMTSFTIDKGAKTAVHEGSFQFIVNKHNPVAADYVLPSWITASGGIYRLNVDKDLIIPTENDGLFYCTDPEMIAVATNEDGNNFYSDGEGYLTLDPGTYDVNFVSYEDMADKIVDIYCGPDSYVGYKGEYFTLPKAEDSLFRTFKGYVYDGQTYESGAKLLIPADLEGDFIIIEEKWEDIEGVTGVFVSENGSDDDTGATRGHAVKTLNKAYEILQTRTAEKKLIVITGTYGFTGGTPSTDEMLTITGDGTGKSVFDLNNDYIVMQGPVTFENIKLSQSTSQSGKAFATNGKELVVGEGVEMIGNTSWRFGVMTPSSSVISPSEKVTLKSGTFNTIYLGTYYNYSVPCKMGGADIVIDGANVKGIALHSDGWLDSQRGSYFTEDVHITVKSGSLGSVTGTLGSPENSKATGFLNGAKLYVLVNNSTETTTLTDFSAYATAGAWSVYAGGKEGATLDYTSDGVYKVNGAKYALATSNDGEQYLSDKGVLTLPSGAYSVELTDDIAYLFDGQNITVYGTCEIDVNTFTAKSVEGKLFIGWTCNGKAVEQVATYNEGDVITANYLDFTTGSTGDFYIVGTQMRTEGVQGLRFIIEKKNAFSDKIPEIIDFGALVLPTDYTRGHDMKYGEKMTNEYAKGLPSGVSTTTWEYNEPAIVKANKLYKTTDDGEQYTVCITGIDETRFDRYYTVKGYMRYRDLNGNDRILYTEYYQTNLYRVALAALDSGEAPTATFENIKTYVEVDRKELYMKENYDNRTPLATAKNGAAKSWQDLEGSANLPDVTNKDFYALKNGIKVREVEYDFSDGKDRDDITIIQFGDTHLNSINDKDWEEADPCILSTYRGRSWNRNGSSVSAINKVMEYASFYDKAVVVGDIMDYFSWGCAEMIQKLIIDKGKEDVILTIGNHEPARLMQNDDSSLKDNMSIEEKYARLQSFWPTDIQYYSEIVQNDDGDDMVMIVAMNNQTYSYSSEQAEKLAADIEKARELGIKIMIFEHTPICTIPGGGEDWLTFFYEPGDTSGMTSIDGVLHSNFGANNFAGSASKYTGATKEVYDLITNNAEIVRGVFCGDWHVNMYSEIQAKTSAGEAMIIPQYVVTANAYSSGSVIKITIK